MPKIIMIATDVDAQLEFMDAMEMKRYDCDQYPSMEVIDLWVNLIREEFEEVRQAISELQANEGYTLKNLAEVGKELADLKVVTNGLAVALGLPFDDIYTLVHQSNMAKLGPDKKPIRREDGKVLKPEGWEKPDILSLLNQVIAAKTQRSF
jgi:predicted HAD superfamily Cof-like phosphohydrolase